MAEIQAFAAAPEASGAPEEEAGARLAAPSRPLEIAVGGGALALSLAALWFSRSIRLRMGAGGLDPKWWPTLLSCLGCGLAVLLLARAFRGEPLGRGDLEAATPEGWARLIGALALSGLYVFAWSRLGYAAPTIAYAFGLLWLFGLRRPLPLILYPLLTTGFIYGVFRILLKAPL